MTNSSVDPVPSAMPSSDSHGHVQPRRGFLGLLAVICGSVAGLVPLGAGLLFFLDPILRKRPEAAGGMVPAIDINDLPADGTPLRVTLRSDQIDAWTMYRDRVIGSIYLRRMPGNQVIAFNDTCTHLGCKVDYQSADKQFFCPCHQSAFDLDGIPKNPTPPRKLDVMKSVVKEDGTVWVEYKNYRSGTPVQEGV